ncbi:MAG TPA: hypothetical protein VFW96_22355 [Thermomicrobiales bacterium]|nr:hypothetical protein [Thermomicrobiales bacterium]
MTTPFPTNPNLPQKPAQAGPPPPNLAPSPDAPYGYTVYVDGNVDGPNTNLYTDHAAVVIVGTVRQVLPTRWDTPDGRRPANPHDKANPYTIYTPVLVDVEQYLKGQQPQSQLLLYAFGGQVGQDVAQRKPDSLYTFHDGERVVLFLSERSHEPRSLNGNPFWDVLEHYTITQDGAATNYYRRVPLAQLRAEIADVQKP